MGFFEVSRGAQRRARIAAGLPDAHAEVFDELLAVVTELPEPDVMCAEERAGTMRVVQQVRNILDAYATAVVGAADTAGDARVLKAGTPGTLVAAATGQTPAVGSGIAATARALRDMPGTASAFRAGRIGTAAVMVLSRSRAHLGCFADVEDVLVEVAATTDAAELRTITEVLIAQDRPDRADHEYAKQREKRGITLREQANGLFRLDGYLDTIEGRRLRDALAVFTDRPVAGDARTAAQRRADALGDIVAAGLAGTRPVGTSGLSVLVDVEHLDEAARAVLDDGTPIGPAQFDRLTCTAICTLILGRRRGDTFVPLALGRTARRATRGQWAALIARDRGCIRCGRAPRFCEAHHIVHWKNGGVTDVSNLVLLCSRCHADLHLGHYTITMTSDQVPIIRPTRPPPIRTG